MKNPKVYVIIPIYNVEPYLRECLDSVVNQTYHNLRIILVNDGSTDNSEAIAKEYLSDERVTLIPKENGGLSSARNVGLQIAYKEGDSEDYVVFLDSDDYMALEYVEKMLESFDRNPKSSISIGAVSSFNKRGILSSGITRDEKQTFSGIGYLETVSSHYFAFSWGGGYKLSFLRDNGFLFVEGIINEDLIFGFQCFLNVSQICFFNEKIFYRVREGSISDPKTFNQHKRELLFKSYLTNFKYLLPIYLDKKYKSIKTLLRNCLIVNAQMPVLCWIRDRKLCTKENLRPLIPFMKIKTRIAYTFPTIARVGLKIKEWIKKCIKKT